MSESLEPATSGTAELRAKRAEIESTRAEMSDTVDAIQERLSPDSLKEQAKDVLREQTVGRAQDVMNEASYRARGAGSTMIETIKQNPIPAAVAGFGLAWLWTKRHQSTPPNRPAYSSVRYATGPKPSAGAAASDTVDRAKAALSDKGALAQEAAGELVDNVQEQAQRLGAQAQTWRDRAQEIFDENPLAVGAAAVGLGLLVAMTVPSHPAEDQLMGEARDTVIDKAKEAAQDLQDKAEVMAEAATSAAQHEAKS